MRRVTTLLFSLGVLFAVGCSGPSNQAAVATKNPPPSRPALSNDICDIPASDTVCARFCPDSRPPRTSLAESEEHDSGVRASAAAEAAAVPAGERRLGCLPPEHTAAAGGLAYPSNLSEYLRNARRYAGNTPALSGTLAMKFIIMDAAESRPWVYLLDPDQYGPHNLFNLAIGCASEAQGRQVLGRIHYRPANGGGASFFFDTGTVGDFEQVAGVHRALMAAMPGVLTSLGYMPLSQAERDTIARQAAQYDRAPFEVVDAGSFSSFQLLNHGAAFGRLMVTEPGTLPGLHDVVLYESLPNELPLVAGILTSVPQTPLSHVNLRAIQSGIPNAYLAGARSDPAIAPLIGQFVYYEVSELGFELRAASDAEVEAYFGGLRPPSPQLPPRDLSIDEITPLGDIGFRDSDSFGAKAANLAEMLHFGFPAGTVPNGAAIPFYFYDEFMKHNGLYAALDDLLMAIEAAPDRGQRSELLSAFRERVRSAEMPEWMMNALTEAHEDFPEGTAVRCRSSTNNEDLPGQSGAGLYESYTHHPQEGHLSKTVKQVFASMWTLRAFEHRDFYRIDHHTAAMGVLMHPNYENERVNGVALSHDFLYGFGAEAFTANSLVGEDLVTNPSASVIPEELIIAPEPIVVSGRPLTHFVQRYHQNDVDAGTLMSVPQILELRDRMHVIVSRFRALYAPQPGAPFAMEVEFKISAENVLVIKQARPWVFQPQAAGTWSEAICECRCEAAPGR